MITTTEEILGNQLKIKKELFLKVSSFSSIELYYYYYQSMSLKVVREKIYLLFSQYCGKTNREREKRSNLSKQTAVCLSIVFKQNIYSLLIRLQHEQ